MPWDILVVMTASGTILYGENRLMVPGLLCGVSGVLLLGISRACFILGSAKAGSGLPSQEAHHGFVMMTLAFGLTTSGIMAYFVEQVQSVWPLSYMTIAVMAINIAAIVRTSFTGTSTISYSALSFGSRTSTSDRSLEVITSIGSNLLLLLVAMFSSPMPYVSWIQMAAYLVSNISLLGLYQTYNIVLACLEIGFWWRKESGIDRRLPSKYIVSIWLTLMVVGTSLILASASPVSMYFLSSNPSATYDRSYQPDSRFDIVVSMYKEDPESVRHLVDQITSTNLLQSLSFEGHKPRIIIYTKNPTADLHALKNTTGADIVERLQNFGREGGTYLAHIVNKWDSLAEQTMFVQAHAHNMRELIPRINDYLVGDTGMLSLGFTGVTCSCGSCSDRWGWEDEFQIIPAIYEQVYGKSCSPSQPILLSYKGQFVASARRIRGIKRDIYAALLDTITSQEGRNSNATFMEDSIKGVLTGEDSPSNPSFGFTMERIWSLLMQCATDDRVATRCPSLLSGKGVGGLVQDCQCLDVLD